MSPKPLLRRPFELLPKLLKGVIWRFPRIGGTLLGVPLIRIIVFWGLYWGPLICGNYHIGEYFLGY